MVVVWKGHWIKSLKHFSFNKMLVVEGCLNVDRLQNVNCMFEGIFSWVFARMLQTNVEQSIVKPARHFQHSTNFLEKLIDPQICPTVFCAHTITPFRPAALLQVCSINSTLLFHPPTPKKKPRTTTQKAINPLTHTYTQTDIQNGMTLSITLAV